MHREQSREKGEIISAMQSAGSSLGEQLHPAVLGREGKKSNEGKRQNAKEQSSHNEFMAVFMRKTVVCSPAGIWEVRGIRKRSAGFV